MLLRHHGLDPALALGGDDLDGSVQRLAFETLAAKDLPDLLALTLRRLLDMTLFHEAHMLIFLGLGLTPGIIGGGHGETVREEIGRTQDEQSLGGEVGADHSSHDRKGRHRAVNAAIDPIAQIARLRPFREAMGYLSRVMAVFEMPGIQGVLLRGSAI